MNTERDTFAAMLLHAHIDYSFQEHETGVRYIISLAALDTAGNDGMSGMFAAFDFDIHGKLSRIGLW